MSVSFMLKGQEWRLLSMEEGACHYYSFNVYFPFKTKSRFIEKYEKLIRKRNNTNFVFNKYAPYGYDAVLMLAHALNATEEKLRKMNQSLREFTYARCDITEHVKEQISKMNDIKGITVSSCSFASKMIISVLFFVNIMHVNIYY